MFGGILSLESVPFPTQEKGTTSCDSPILRTVSGFVRERINVLADIDFTFSSWMDEKGFLKFKAAFVRAILKEVSMETPALSRYRGILEGLQRRLSNAISSSVPSSQQQALIQLQPSASRSQQQAPIEPQVSVSSSQQQVLIQPCTSRQAKSKNRPSQPRIVNENIPGVLQYIVRVMRRTFHSDRTAEGMNEKEVTEWLLEQKKIIGGATNQNSSVVFQSAATGIKRKLWQTIRDNVVKTALPFKPHENSHNILNAMRHISESYMVHLGVQILFH
ncbi:hypothetical protein FGB62_206g00 [Gracilaria domingensis]|nr:hypothetical protein FGB62_416g03 [Gracilaria domingensis]KAI0558497.1 hypothetical protein FGB62_206g00 [Gracilaria domingensis]